MNTLDVLKLVSIINKYKQDLRDAYKGMQIKGLDVLTFKAFGKHFSLSLYITCMKD